MPGRGSHGVTYSRDMERQGAGEIHTAAPDPAAVAAGLLPLLRAHQPRVRGYAEEPERMKGGWEAYVYGLRLEAPGAEGLWHRPLVVRLPRDPGDGTGAQREADVLRFLAAKRFPVPRPVLSGSTDLGPVLMSERVDAVPVFDRPEYLRHPGRTMDLITDLHVRLHKVDADSWPLPADGPLVDRRLDRIEELLAGGGTNRQYAAFDWLRHRRTAVTRERRSVIHGDWVGNVLATEDGELIVVDWGAAEVGDPHDDIARTWNIFWILSAVAPLRVLRVPLGMVLWRASRRYRRAYERHGPVDRRRVLYWSALQTLEWSLMTGVLSREVLRHGDTLPRRVIAGDIGRGSARLLGHFMSLTGAHLP